ncbi:MAG: LysR family transcriptional regulator [Janthinobacterium lividum]|uniref:LysR family transcriptional regulator n=1 Tax=Pseudomonas sp. MWU16-30317 TaxID=2878095 RepID=UPI001CFC3EBC|nr:LysR family transcriptional regulator [Pseudomonas sp. MWU16-30317]
MNQLHAMRVFCSLVEAQGFSAAAERLDTTHSSVSRHLQQLEAELGVRLVNRTTRQLSLTAAGQDYYAACVDILERVDAAAALCNDHQQPSGRLKVSLPLVVGTLELGQWLPAFEQRYPQIQLELSCADRFVDLVAEGFDVALRISGPLADTSLVSRLLDVSPMVLVASPHYLQSHGTPLDSAALPAHRLLAHSGGSDWQLHSDNAMPQPTRPGNGLRADTITSLYAAALAGAGIAAFTFTTVKADLREGRLIRVLPQYTLGDRHYHVLYPHARHLPGKVRAFVDFMVEHYTQMQP